MKLEKKKEVKELDVKLAKQYIEMVDEQERKKR